MGYTYENEREDTLEEQVGTIEELQAEYEEWIEQEVADSVTIEIDDLEVHGEVSINAIAPEYREVHVLHTHKSRNYEDVVSHRGRYIEALATAKLQPFGHDYLVRIRFNDGRTPKYETAATVPHFEYALNYAAILELKNDAVVEIWCRRHYWVEEV